MPPQFVILQIVLALVIGPRLLLLWRKPEPTQNQARDRLYARCGMWFEEEAALKIIREEESGRFRFSPQELRMLADLRAHTPYASLPFEIGQDN